MLSLQSIFSSTTFGDEGFDRPRWYTDGSYYTTLRKVKASTPKLSELTSTTASSTTTKNVDIDEIVWHDAETGDSKVMVNSKDLTPPEAELPLSIDDYTISADRVKILIFTNAEKVWRLKTRGSYWILDLSKPAGSKDRLFQLGASVNSIASSNKNNLMFATFSPDGSKVAYVRERNIYVEHLSATHDIINLTSDGSEMIINGTFDWVYEEEFMLRNGIRWSPDGKFIAYWQIDQTEVPIMYLINNTDAEYATVIPIPYPKTGQVNPSARIGCVSANGGETKWIPVPGDSRNNYITDLGYVKSSGKLIIQQMNRLQNHLTVFQYDAGTGTLEIVHTEVDAAWIDAQQNVRFVLEDTCFLFLSEVNGYRQIVLVSLTGESVKMLTPPTFDAEMIVGCDEVTGRVYFIASPDDPIRRYLYSTDITGKLDVVRITPAETQFVGTNYYCLSHDGRQAVHSFSSAHRPPMTSLITLPDHKTSKVLAENITLLQAFDSVVSPPIEFFRVNIGNGIELDGWALHPSYVDKSALHTYPVIFHVYGEPAAQIVRDHWMGRTGLFHRMLAERGAIVICVDNRGTPSLRGYHLPYPMIFYALNLCFSFFFLFIILLPAGSKWRKCIYRQVGILASSDQAGAAREILKERQYLDPSRVAVWGWSGGGSMSLNALFRYPDLYGTAVSV